MVCAGDGILGRGFDAVVLDLTIPGGMGGIEAAAKLKEMDPSAELIATSGYSDAPVMSESRKYDFDEVIPKPWTPAQVGEIFKRVLLTNRACTRPDTRPIYRETAGEAVRSSIFVRIWHCIAPFRSVVRQAFCRCPFLKVYSTLARCSPFGRISRAVVVGLNSTT